MNVSKTIYSEKLGKNLDFRLFENKSDTLSDSVAISVIVYTDGKPEKINNNQVYAFMPVSEKIFEKTYYVKNDENKLVVILKKAIPDCENKVTIDVAAVEKFNKKTDEELVLGMFVDFKKRIEKLENGKADKVSGEETINTIIDGLKRLGVNIK